MELPQKIFKEVEDILNNIGLSKTEILVFLFLFSKNGSLRATEISKKTKINRTTLYGILKSLQKHKLISLSDESGVLMFQSIDPSLLPSYIDQIKENLTRDVKKAKDLVSIISEFRNKEESRPFPTIQFFDGVKGVEQVYEKSLNENKSKTIHELIGTKTLYSLLDFNFINGFVEKRLKKGIHMSTFATKSDEANKMEKEDSGKLRTTTVLPSGYDFDVGFIVYDDSVVITSFAKDHPLGITITDSKIADAMRTLFRYIKDTNK